MSIHWTKIRHFKPEEFSHPELLRWEMLEKLEALREALGFPLIITSSYRSPEHNATLPNAAKDSAHCPAPDGKYSGIDIATANLGGTGLFRLVREAYAVGLVRIGLYPNHVHFDVEDRLPQQVLWVGKD